jgi:type IV secretory pathway VirJ component
MPTVLHRLFAVACMASFSGPALAAPREITVEEEALGNVAILAPADEPQTFVALLSDKPGITPGLRRDAEALVEKGAAVALIDTPTLVRGLAQGEEVDCHYAFGDIEDVARSAQRALSIKVWRWPVLLGEGELGGTLAYLALAQAPLNTAAGAVSTGFASRFASKLKLCGGAPGAKVEDGAWNYSPYRDLPGRWAFVGRADGPAAPFLKAGGASAAAVAAPGDDAARFAAAMRAALDIGAPPHEELGDLPLIELPTDGPPKALAVFYSGDGGWRDIDKSIGEALSAKGIAVVGVDSLRYFWSEKSPAAIAADLDRILAHYRKAWGAPRVSVMGYSFGADIIPFAWRELPEASRRGIDLVALMGLEPTADFEVSVSGLLGVSSSADVDVRPALRSLPPEKTLCFYGEEEVEDEDTACTAPEIAKATLVKRPGGHHFDGDYEPVATMITGRLLAGGK